MKKIVIPILAVVFVLSLAFIAGAQSSSSGQSPTQPYGTYREGGSGESGGPTGSSQSGTSQPHGTGQSGTTDQYRGKKSQQYSSRGQGQSTEDYKASNWIGMRIENRQGENLGKIQDLVLNPDGQVDFVIVSYGGALGIGEKYTAVPFRSFSRKDDKTLVLDMSKEKMTQAPSFDKNNWPDMTNRQWSEDVYRYHGQKPYWGESHERSIQQPSRTEQNPK